jgi:hypothetical protein
MTFFLRFPDESTGMGALDAAGFIGTLPDQDESFVIKASHTHALDVIGPIYIGGIYDVETDEVIEPPLLLEGWHVNFVGELPESLTEYLVTPANPVRVFAS